MSCGHLACNKCGYIGRPTPEACPKCGSWDVEREDDTMYENENDEVVADDNKGEQ